MKERRRRRGGYHSVTVYAPFMGLLPHKQTFWAEWSHKSTEWFRQHTWVSAAQPQTPQGAHLSDHTKQKHQIHFTQTNNTLMLCDGKFQPQSWNDWSISKLWEKLPLTKCLIRKQKPQLMFSYRSEETESLASDICSGVDVPLVPHSSVHELDEATVLSTPCLHFYSLKLLESFW